MAQWWGGEAGCKTLEETRSKYAPRLREDSHVRPYVAILSGEPIGYALRGIVTPAGRALLMAIERPAG